LYNRKQYLQGGSRMKKYLGLLIMWSVAICLGVIPSGLCQEGGSLALVNGLLIDGTGSDPLPGAVVLIEGGLIAAVGTTESVKIPEKAERIDLDGSVLLPGLINAHVHRGYDRQRLMTWARAGVTTVRDLSYSDMGSKWFEIRDKLLQDPFNARLVAVGPFITTPEGYPMQPWGVGAMTVEGPEDAARKAEKLLGQGADLLKIAIENGKTFRVSLPVLSTEEAAAVAAAAHKHGTVVSSHTTSSADLPSLLDAKVDDIAHMVVDELSDDLVARVIKDDVYWVPTLELWYHVEQYLKSMNVEYTPHKIAVSNLEKFVKAGGKVALGTDYDGFNALFELGLPAREISSMQEAGMTPMQIIVAATKNAAHVCNLEGKLGTVEAGKTADIIVLNRNPLEDMKALADVRIVIHNGNIIRDER
jgi:imidazolonepropionase-like amidohydrolase